MKRLTSIAAVLAILGIIGGCTTGSDPFVYGSEVMTETEIEEFRVFLATTENPERQAGIDEQKLAVEERAAQLGITLQTRIRQRSTASRLGRGAGSPMDSGFYGPANSTSATPQ